MDKSASPLRRLRLSPGRRARWRRRVARRVLSFALLTSALLTVFFSTRAPAADGHLVIVAADDLTAGRILTGEDLREVAVPFARPREPSVMRSQAFHRLVDDLTEALEA